MKMTIGTLSRPKLSSRARLETDRVTGKPLVLYPDGILALNRVGFLAASLCTGERTLQQILDLLRANNGSEPQRELEHDVEENLLRLQSRNLLEDSQQTRMEIEWR